MSSYLPVEKTYPDGNSDKFLPDSKATRDTFTREQNPDGFCYPAKENFVQLVFLLKNTFTRKQNQ